MAKLSLFQYVVLQHPSKEDEKEGKGETKILIELTTKLAKDEKQLSVIIARNLPEDVIDKLDQVEIKIRPF